MPLGRACTPGVAAYQICTAAAINFGDLELPQAAACAGVATVSAGTCTNALVVCGAEPDTADCGTASCHALLYAKQMLY